MFGVHPSVYGINRRNRTLISRLNSRSAIALANDKVECKKACEAHGIAVPKTYAVIHANSQIPKLLPILRELEGGFVIKPSQGAQGRGVMIFSRALESQVLPAHEEPWSIEDFNYYICRVISGEFTKGRVGNSVLVEERIHPDSAWILPELPGPPDLRIIVFRGEPVLGMARLPTLISNGKANLHQGGVGLGIDLVTGLSTHAIWKEKPIEYHPDSALLLAGREIEGLAECIELARLCAKAVPLGYLGVDIMRDLKKGPCVIEVNARPGLAIQLANRKGLGTALPLGVENRS